MADYGSRYQETNKPNEDGTEVPRNQGLMDPGKLDRMVAWFRAAEKTMGLDGKESTERGTIAGPIILGEFRA
jgi:hypothetical protein